MFENNNRSKPMSKGVRSVLLAGLAGLLAMGMVWAQGATFKLTIKEHRFDPVELVVPAGQPITLEIRNADATPEEFESHSLNREKVIAGGTTAVIHLGALKAGTYEFVGEFHEDTAKGRIIAR
jgi:plastocyanin